MRSAELYSLKLDESLRGAISDLQAPGVWHPDILSSMICGACEAQGPIAEPFNGSLLTAAPPGCQEHEHKAETVVADLEQLRSGGERPAQREEVALRLLLDLNVRPDSLCSAADADIGQQLVSPSCNQEISLELTSWLPVAWIVSAFRCMSQAPILHDAPSTGMLSRGLRPLLEY